MADKSDGEVGSFCSAHVCFTRSSFIFNYFAYRIILVWLNKLHRRYGRPRRGRRFAGHRHISVIDGSPSGISSPGIYQAGQAGAELIPDTPDFISDSRSPHWCGDINPVSGPPMMENSCIDVGGNVLRDNSMTSIDTSF